MRGQDLEIGRTYVIAGPNNRTVKVLDTPPELQSKARVMVQLESGISRGKVKDIPTRNVLRPTHGPAPERPRPRSRRPRVIQTDRDPMVGDVVLWKETGPVEWDVEAIDRQARRATIKSVILGCPTERTLPFSDLQVRPEEVVDGEADRADDELLPEERQPPTRSEVPLQSLAPEPVRRELDELMDDILFSHEALEAYRVRYARTANGPAVVERLREEIKRRGFIDRPRPGRREYGRICVEGRFEFELFVRPTPEDLLTVQQLTFPRRQRSNRTRPKQQRPRRQR